MLLSEYTEMCYRVVGLGASENQIPTHVHYDQLYLKHC